MRRLQCNRTIIRNCLATVLFIIIRLYATEIVLTSGEHYNGFKDSEDEKSIVLYVNGEKTVIDKTKIASIDGTPVAQSATPAATQPAVVVPAPAAKPEQVQPVASTPNQANLPVSTTAVDSDKLLAERAHNDSVIIQGRLISARNPADLFNRLTYALPPSTSPRRIMILPFASNDVGGADGHTAAEYAVVHFTNQPGFIVVERDRFESAMKEIALSQSGMVPDSLVLKAGALLSANYFVTGTVAKSGLKKVFFARLVDIETGRVISAASAECAETELTNLYRDAFGEKASPGSALFRSMVLPGWGQYYSKEPVGGTISLLAFLGSAGFLGYSAWDFVQKDNTLKTYELHYPETVDTTKDKSIIPWLKRATAAQSARNNAATLTNIAIGITAGVWICNLIDAYLAGSVESKRIRKIYFTMTPLDGGLSFSITGGF